jgi:very-short-patch-repair endonuclease
VIGQFVVDFACLSDRLVIEVDGPTHESPETTHFRNSWLHSVGYRILRFSVGEIDDNLGGVVEMIWLALDPVGFS